MVIGMNFPDATHEAVENFLMKWKKYREKVPYCLLFAITPTGPRINTHS
jgi:hypothetical protein